MNELHKPDGLETVWPYKAMHFIKTLYELKDFFPPYNASLKLY